MSEAESAQRRALLARVLDEIIPPSADGSLPGAGALGLAEPLERALGGQAGLESLLAQGLACVRRRAGERDAAGLAALAEADRAAVMREVEAEEPAFLGLLVLHTYLAYYAHPLVTERLGVRSPPQPEGHELEPGDLSLLEPVRERRPGRFREC